MKVFSFLDTGTVLDFFFISCGKTFTVYCQDRLQFQLEMTRRVPLGITFHCHSTRFCDIVVCSCAKVNDLLRNDTLSKK